MNLSLAVFNLIRCRPLTAAVSFFVFCRKSCTFKPMKYERYIMLAVLGTSVFWACWICRCRGDCQSAVVFLI